MSARFMVVVMVGVAGCTTGSERIALPDGDPFPDAGSRPFEPHPCQEALLSSDFWNCGACGDVCDVADADRCAGGDCACGNGPPCAGGADCRYGRCIPVDAAGDVCEFDDACPAGHACIEAHCSPLRCIDEELCDGIDNDCDGETDEGADGPLARWCFDGTYGAEVGEVPLPCQRGVQVCAGGDWSACVGEVPPVAEQGLLGCDGADNDCDGCVDGVRDGAVCVSSEPTGFDIVFVIDTSGSMGDEIEAVKAATRAFTETFSENPAFRFAIVRAPSSASFSQADVLSDLAEFDAFVTVLDTVTTNGSGDEPTWDAVYEIGTGELALDWRDGSTRIIVLFTDEEGQTYRARRGLPAVSEADMCGSFAHGEVLAAVVAPAFATHFDDCGPTFALSNDAVSMAASLGSIIADPCT